MPGLRAAVTVALVVLIVGTGTLAGSAYWASTATKSATVTAASVGTAATASGLAVTYKGVTPVSAGVPSHTGTVTVANTGSAPLAYAVTTSGGNTAFNARITLQVWKRDTTLLNCTTAAGNATTGTLAAPPALPAADAVVAGGATTVFCVRTTLTGPFSTAAGSTTTVAIVATGTVGSHWTATSTTAAFTQNAVYTWYRIVHKQSALCATNGTLLGLFDLTVTVTGCKTSSTTDNQAFRFERVGETDLYRVFSGNGSATTGPVWQAASDTVGAGVDPKAPVYTDTTAGNNQQLRLVADGAAGDYMIQLKTPATGTTRCLNLVTNIFGSYDLQGVTAGACSFGSAVGSASYRAQHFTLTEIAP
jgi:hypothetical protein